MYKDAQVCAVLPARDEAVSIEHVIEDLHSLGVFDRIIVCDNGSTDATPTLAAAAGAEVVNHPYPGYGGACQRALGEIESTDIVVFVDADNSLRIDESLNLLESVHQGADLVIGTRIRPWRERNSMGAAQIIGNWLACTLVTLIWRHPISDLGPFRAIRYASLVQLGMEDQRFGWTVEMQVKSILLGLRLVEVPVHYHRRLGRSKISGTVRGVIAAAWDIIGTIVKLAFRSATRQSATAAALKSKNH